MKPDEIEDLIARYMGEALSEEEERKLLELVERSPEVRDALGLEMLIDRVVRESRKPPVDPERTLRALPRGRQDDFIRTVMSRLPKGSGVSPAQEASKSRFRSAVRRPLRKDRQGWSTPYLLPSMIASGVMAALLFFATFGQGPRDPGSEAHGKFRTIPLEGGADGGNVSRPEGASVRADEEWAAAERDRKGREDVVAALRREEAEAARERDRAAGETEVNARRKAEEDLEKIKTERRAEEARLVDARERERRAAAAAARAAEVHPLPEENPSPARTLTAIATIERLEGNVMLLAGKDRTAGKAGQMLFPGQGVETPSREGSAILVFADRTRLELGSGTEIRDMFDQEAPGKGARGKRLFVAKGRISAAVAKQLPDQPFVLSTPHGEARVLGTTLRLTVDPTTAGGSTRLEVMEGRVRLLRIDGKAVDVPSGHVASAGAEADLAPKPILDRLHYEAAVVKRPDLLFFEDFEQDAWKRHWSSPSEISRVTEDRAFTLIGRRALEVRCKAGESATDGWHRLTIPNGFPKVHMRAYFYFPKDFDPAGGVSLLRIGALPSGPGVEEGMSLWADHTPSGRDFFSAALVLTARWTLQFYYYHPDQTHPKGESAECDPTGAVWLKPGRWHSIELLGQANDPGLKNGVLRAWVDGASCGEAKGIRFRDVDTLQIREMALTGGGGPSRKNQSYFVEDVAIARDYIGCSLGDGAGVEPRSNR